MITQTYNIDLIPSGVPTIVHVSQYDSASRTIAMSIYDGGVAYDLTDKIVTVRGTKQDNTGFEYPCTVDGNVASFVLNAQMTIFSGDVPCEIRIAENGCVIGSHNFVLQVERTPLDSSIVISDTELPLIEEAEQNAIRAEQAADEAEELLSTVVKSVNSVTPDAQGNVDVVALPTGGTAGQYLRKESSADGDADWQNIDASSVVYDNTSSGLTATDVQAAIDETSATKLSIANANSTFTKILGDRLTGVIPNGTAMSDYCRTANVPVGLSFWSIQNASDNPLAGLVATATIFKPIASGQYSVVLVSASENVFISAQLGATGGFTFFRLYRNRRTQLLDASSIPTTAQSYSCAWSNYDYLEINSGSYNNMSAQFFVTKDYFENTSAGGRAQLYDATNSRTYEIYKHDDSHVYIKASVAGDATHHVRIYGIR